jgi:chorismate-pyruvate lyase
MHLEEAHMSEQETDDFDTQLAAVERFIADVQQGSVPTGEAMRAYRDVHRPAIERLRAQLTEFEALLAEAGVADSGQVPDVASGSA